MREHVRCSKCQVWLRFRSDPLFGRVWQECDCGTARMPRQDPSDVNPDRTKRCQGCGGPVAPGRRDYCGLPCMTAAHRKTAKLEKTRVRYLHKYPRRGPKNTWVPSRAEIPPRWG